MPPFSCSDLTAKRDLIIWLLVCDLSPFTKPNAHTCTNNVKGRLYNYHLLDMIELGIERFRSHQEFKVTTINSSPHFYCHSLSLFFLFHFLPLSLPPLVPYFSPPSLLPYCSFSHSLPSSFTPSTLPYCSFPPSLTSPSSLPYCSLPPSLLPSLPPLPQSKSCALGSKPFLVFAGDLFETELEYMRLKNLLTGIYLNIGGMYRRM